MSLSETEEFLSSEVERMGTELLQKSTQLASAMETIRTLESVLHRATLIAGHIPSLCQLVEGSGPVEQAAMELYDLLVNRRG